MVTAPDTTATTELVDTAGFFTGLPGQTAVTQEESTFTHFIRALVKLDQGTAVTDDMPLFLLQSPDRVLATSAAELLLPVVATAYTTVFTKTQSLLSANPWAGERGK